MGKGAKVCSRHLAKLAAPPINGKDPYKTFSSGTSGHISRKVGMWHLGLRSMKICSNYDHGLTLTYFTARSNVLP